MLRYRSLLASRFSPLAPRSSDACPPLARGLLLSLLLPLAALAQEGAIAIRADAGYQPEAHKFSVVGETDLPDHAVLGLLISFCGEVVPGAVARAEVKGGQFTISFGPIDRHVLAGTYDLEVKYERFDQVPSVKARLADAPEQRVQHVAYYVGTREEEAQENKQYQESLKDALDRTGKLYGELRVKAKAYLVEGKKFNEAEFVAWMKDWRSKLAGLQKLADSIGAATVFAPKYPESVRDLTVIASFLDLLFLQYFRDICQKNGLDPGGAESLDPRPPFSLMVDEYIREIDRRMEEIQTRQDEKREPTSFDLYRDLLDYQGLFSSLIAAYDRARKDPDPEGVWKRRDPPWIAAMDGFTSRIARYKGSAIERVHPEVEGGLAAALAALAKGLSDLDALFAKLNWKEVPQDGALPPALKEPVERIKARFKKLYDIVLLERDRTLADVEGRLMALSNLSSELDVAKRKADSGGAKKDDWEKFLAGWRDRLAKQREGLAKWTKESQATFHVPEAPRRLNVLGQCLAWIAEYFDDEVSGQKTDKIEERLRYNLGVRQTLVKQIRQEVEEVRGRK